MKIPPVRADLVTFYLSLNQPDIANLDSGRPRVPAPWCPPKEEGEAVPETM